MKAERVLAKARKLRNRGAYRKAMDLLSRSCRTEEHNPDLWVELALVAQKATELRPAADAFFRAGELYLRAGEIGEARILMHRALALDPSHSGALRLMHVINRRNPAPEPHTPVVAPEEPVVAQEEPEALEDPAEVEIDVIDEPATRTASAEPANVSRETQDYRRATAIANAVLSSELLLSLPSDRLLELSRSATVLECAAGEEIFAAGDDATGVFLITTGAVRVRVTDRGSWTYKTGTLLGGEALLGFGPLVSSAVAAADCSILQISIHTLRRLDDDQPGLFQSFVEAAQPQIEAVYLYNQVFAGRCDAPALRELLEISELRNVDHGEVLLSQGERPTGLFIIVHGDFQITRSDGRETRYGGRLQAGQLAGAELVLSGDKADATLTAKSAGWILFAPRPSLARLVTAYPLLLESISSN